MSLKFNCARCDLEINKKAALLFGPPDDQDYSKKTHLCTICYEIIIGFIQTDFSLNVPGVVIK